jgi:hypothetical protein
MIGKSALKHIGRYLAIGAASFALYFGSNAKATPVTSSNVPSEINFAERNRASVNAGVSYSQNSGVFAGAYVPVKDRFSLDGRLNVSKNSQAMVGVGYNKLSDKKDSIIGANVFGDFGYVNGAGIGVDYIRPRWSVHANGYIGSNDEVSHKAVDVEAVGYFFRKDNYRAGVFGGLTYAIPETCDSQINFTAGLEAERDITKKLKLFGEVRFDSNEMYDSKGVSAKVGLSYSFGKNASPSNRFQGIRRRQPHFHPCGMTAPVQKISTRTSARTVTVTPEPVPTDTGITGEDEEGNAVGNTGITGEDEEGNAVGNTGITGEDES